MSTVCKICVHATDEDVARWIREFLEARGSGFDELSSEWPEASDRETFHPDSSFPTILSMKQVTENITEISYNSFGDVSPLALAISERVTGPVVVNVFQSTAMASDWILYSGGHLLRKILAEDGELTSQEGTPLEFEGQHPGRDITEEEDEEPIIMFDDIDMSACNTGAGIVIDVHHDGGSGWKNFRIATAATRRPWWRFW